MRWLLWHVTVSADTDCWNISARNLQFLAQRISRCGTKEHSPGQIFGLVPTSQQTEKNVKTQATWPRQALTVAIHNRNAVLSWEFRRFWRKKTSYLFVAFGTGAGSNWGNDPQRSKTVHFPLFQILILERCESTLTPHNQNFGSRENKTLTSLKTIFDETKFPRLPDGKQRFRTMTWKRERAHKGISTTASVTSSSCASNE